MHLSINDAFTALECLEDTQEFVETVKARKVIAFAPVKKAELPQINIEETQQRSERKMV